MSRNAISDAIRDTSNRDRYRAAYESPAAKEWIKNLPPALRKRAEEIGLLKPYIDPPSFAMEYKEVETASNWKGTFDENDFAFAALDSPESPAAEFSDEEEPEI